MIHTIRLVLILAFVSISASAHAEDNAKLRNLLSLVGFDPFLASIPSAIIHSMEKSLNSEADELKREAIGELVAMHFSPSGVKQDILDSMANTLSDAQLDELSAYYSAGVGKRATELEVATQQPGMEEVVEIEGLEILRWLIDSNDERLLAYERMVTATDALELNLTLAMNMNYAVLSGMMGSPQLPYALTDEEILEIVSRQGEQMREYMIDAIFVIFAYTYREMSIEDVDAYATFLESDVSQAHFSSMNTALQNALVPRVRAFGHELMVMMGVRQA
ncbi:MAG: hypothetical protein O7H40_00710 [Gammaproteobacteria bacterium]|nr:hypothetical protein [Gammaproteobacteria bacterium]